MASVDFVIAGQGLAGTTLAWQLRRRGRSVLVIDREGGTSASRVAAGLVTPVTGKRLAKSWRWAELLPAAFEFYSNFEAVLGTRFYSYRRAVRLLADEEEQERFRRRAANQITALVELDCTVNPEWFAAPFGAFGMWAARLDVPSYLDASREHFRRHGAYLTADIDPARDVELISTGVRLPRLDVEAGGLAFCRGFAPDADPWFGGIKFNAAKGEILTLRIPDLAEERVVHRGVWLAAVGGDVFRCGATYSWDDLNCVPTASGRAEIEGRLREFLRVPFEVIGHDAAVRPVIDAGFPVLGRHPQFPQLAYFNGLGSKGSLLAPFFASQLAECLLGERSPDPEVDVRRYLVPKPAPWE